MRTLMTVVGATVLGIFVPLSVLFLGIWIQSADGLAILLDMIFFAVTVLGFITFTLGAVLEPRK